MNNQYVQWALKEILSKCGEEIINNHSTFKSAVFDLINDIDYHDERVAMRHAMESQTFWILLSTKALTADTVRNFAEQMRKESHMTQEDAEFVAWCVAYVRGYEQLNEPSTSNGRIILNEQVISSQQNTSYQYGMSSQQNTPNQQDVSSQQNILYQQGMSSQQNTPNQQGMSSQQSTSYQQGMSSQQNTPYQYGISSQQSTSYQQGQQINPQAGMTGAIGLKCRMKMGGRIKQYGQMFLYQDRMIFAPDRMNIAPDIMNRNGELLYSDISEIFIGMSKEMTVITVMDLRINFKFNNSADMKQAAHFLKFATGK